MIIERRKERRDMKVDTDDGYYYGLGIFETIAVENNRPQFLEEHLQRLSRSMRILRLLPRRNEEGGAECRGGITERRVNEWLEEHPITHGALKITVSEKNVLLEEKRNIYTRMQYEQGFTTDFSYVRRNSTSIFTYLKSLNYGDNIWEKRKARKRGIDEPIFLNEHGEICEGAVSNLFFVEEGGRVVTPKLSCGLLRGVVRQVLLERGMAEEAVIYPKDIKHYKEVFLTNSLMRIMPVRNLAGYDYKERVITRKLMEWLERI
ncbi:aminotransferase class IV [Qiania dongpingensis]|uniref:Aminotransferase class IV n=2 Tax=Qiania dongpingensis TaxID=2763669 RepID=A0A7G9G5X5_9FIRM|nr:aminotransferase class IV [Qiania dongpingensis]